MKLTLSLIVIGALIAPALPVAAEEAAVRNVNPIGAARGPEILRSLAGLPARRPARSDDTPLLAWSQVRDLKPGDEVRLMAPDAVPITRYFVSADERTLTVLNLDQPGLSRAASRAMRELLSHNPAVFARTDRGELVLGDAHVRLASEGLFVGHKKVADRDEFVQTIARTDVQHSMAIGQARHKGLSPAAKVAIGVAVTVGTLLILARIMPSG